MSQEQRWPDRFASHTSNSEKKWGRKWGWT